VPKVEFAFRFPLVELAIDGVPNPAMPGAEGPAGCHVPVAGAEDNPLG
jgi:hypothetical protein